MRLRHCALFSALLNFVSELLYGVIRAGFRHIGLLSCLHHDARRGSVKSNPHLLIVDDDAETLRLLSDFFQSRGLSVSVAGDGATMRSLLLRASFDLVILDVMLPDANGFDLCRELRARSPVPVIMLTAVAGTTDRVVGLEIGADDYVPKPFDPLELLARVRAVLRRHEAGAKPNRDAARIYRFDGWTLDCGKHRLMAPGDVRVELTNAEFNLLLAFVRSAQRVLTRDQLIELAGGETGASYDRSVDILISRLRRKMEDDPRAPQLIRTVRSGGYQFVPEVISA
jgi:two-component system OmpR family response regulator